MKEEEVKDLCTQNISHLEKILKLIPKDGKKQYGYSVILQVLLGSCPTLKEKKEMLTNMLNTLDDINNVILAQTN